MLHHPRTSHNITGGVVTYTSKQQIDFLVNFYISLLRILNIISPFAGTRDYFIWNWQEIFIIKLSRNVTKSLS